MGSIVEETNFITKEFLEKALLNSKIKSFKIKLGSNPGDNFSSVLYGIEIQLVEDEEKDKSIHFLLKALPVDVGRQKYLNESNVFRKELHFYDTLVPELNKFAKEQCQIGNGNGVAIKLAIPPFVHGAVTNSSSDTNNKDGEEIYENGINRESNYILMVDLRKTFGFKMADRCIGLDIHHCYLVIEEIAILHALNWSYCCNKGLTSMKSKFSTIMEETYSKNKELLSIILKQMYEMLRPGLEKVLGVESEAVKGFSKLFCEINKDPAEHLFMYINENGPIDEEYVSNILRVKPKENIKDPWMIGSHGDCWVNNMLFKYDEVNGKPLEIVLLDFQAVREACPTIDLSYFFYTSTTHTLRKKHLNELLELYTNSFISFCNELNTKTLPIGFSSTEVKKRFHRSKIFGLMTACMLLPHVLRNSKDSVDLSKLKNDETKDESGQLSDIVNELFKDCGENIKLRDRFVELVQELYDDGII